MFKRSWFSFVATVSLLAFTGMLMSGCAGWMKGHYGHHKNVAAKADLMDADGNNAGMVKFYESGKADKVGVSAKVKGLPAGFHGFHIHETGACEPNFKAADGHLNPGNENHGLHAGDMPVLLVNQDGTAKLYFRTDRITLDELTAGDGTAIIVHEKPDNYTNIPERYAPNGPDETTLAVGDAGGRLACGVVQAH
jgi:Cu-Zn family superoxide dismutase